MTEEAFKDWKNQTRQEALEKEVQRLRERTHRQSGKIASLRRTVYFTTLFFTALLTIMFMKGMIVISSENREPANGTEQLSDVVQEPVAVQQEDNTKEEPAMIPDSIPVPVNKTKGLIYCVQIGAYTSVNLDDYEENLISLQQDSYDGINQLTLGRFNDYGKALAFLDVVKRIGFKDAFIMKFFNGKRIPVKTESPDSVSLPPANTEPALPDNTSTDSVATIEASISDSLFQ
jgi:hypothetical protein